MANLLDRVSPNIPGQEVQQTTIMTDDAEHAEELSNMSINDFSNQAFLTNKIPPKLKKFINMKNIADNISDEDLEKIASVIIDSFNTDKESRHEWDEILKEAYKLVNSKLEYKNTPWEGAANIKYPMMTVASIQFNARILPQIIKNDKVVLVKSMLNDDNAHTSSNRAERLSTHMSYQMIEQSNHWLRDTDKLFMVLPIVGTVFRKSFFNTIKGIPDTQLCLPHLIVINNEVESLEAAQRITHVLYMTTNELIENMRMGLFVEYDVDELISNPDEDKPPEIQSFSVSKDVNNNFYDTVHEIYEQHRYLDLDGDGYQEPYIVTVHKDSQKVLRIVARYDESCFEYNENGKFVSINPIQYFTDYHFWRNPDGSFYSLGFGALLLSINETVNTITNQLIDAGTLSNRGAGFVDARLLKGDYEFRIGERKGVTLPLGTRLSDHFYEMPFKEPSQTLFNLLGFLVDTSRGITTVSEIMEGNIPPPNTPATTVMALVEQGQQVYSSILNRIYDSLKREFQKLYDINRKYLKDEEQFPMAQGTGMVTIQDYMMPNYGIYPVADPKMSSSMERMSQAQALLQLANYPQINMHEVLKNYLETLKIQNPENYLVQRDPNAPPPPEVKAMDAQIRNIEMDTACKLLDRELKAWETGIDEMKVKSQSAYYGGQLATDKVDSIVKLTELESKVPPAEIEKAAVEEEVLTKETQLQDVAPEFHARLGSLEDMVRQMLSSVQAGGIGQPPAPMPMPMEEKGSLPPSPMEGEIPPSPLPEEREELPGIE